VTLGSREIRVVVILAVLATTGGCQAGPPASASTGTMSTPTNSSIPTGGAVTTAPSTEHPGPTAPQGGVAGPGAPAGRRTADDQPAPGQQGPAVILGHVDTQANCGPVPGPALRLITCDGPYDRVAGGYQDHLVVCAS
jgi:hypothetical protein